MTTRSSPSKRLNGPRRLRPARKSKTKDHSRAASSKHQTIKDPRSEFSDEEWHDMVAQVAYFRAEARGFTDGSSDEDWYEAEAELRERLAKGDETREVDEIAAPGTNTST